MKKTSIFSLLFLTICILAVCLAGCQNTTKPSSGSKDGHYESELGWQVHYDPEYVAVEEKDANDVIFKYLGEAVGDNYVEIQYFPDRMPREVLDEILEEADEDSDKPDEASVEEFAGEEGLTPDEALAAGNRKTQRARPHHSVHGRGLRAAASGRR